MPMRAPRQLYIPPLAIFGGKCYAKKKQEVPFMDKWDKRFIELADTIGEWSSCFKENRHVGAVVVRNKRILTTGYNGAPAGIRSCEEKGECMRL